MTPSEQAYSDQPNPMPQAFPFDIQRVITESQDRLVAQTVENLRASVEGQVVRYMNSQVEKIVTEFVTKELAVELNAQLLGNKSAIIAAASVVAGEIASNIAASIAKSVADTLSNDWKRREVIKSLFQ